MKNRFYLHQKFSHKMALTPQMKHSIKLLSMSTKDLNEHIAEILANNPFLQKLVEKKGSDNIHKPTPSSALRLSEEYENNIKDEENPRLNLLSQLKMSDMDSEYIKIAEYLVFEMDDNGYIAIDPEDAARELSVDVDEVEYVISVIQTMEPAGIGAKDIQECLQLQLRRKGMQDSPEYKIVSSMLPEVARNDLDKISRSLDIDRDRVSEAIKNIKKLDPRPAGSILPRSAAPVIPEIFAKVDKKKIRLEINRSYLPQLKLYNPYEKEMDIIKDDEARKFLKENMDTAKSLIDSLKRREDTMCRVTDYILNAQKTYIAGDPSGIRALTVKEVSSALKLHPSTISRAVSNKYVQINDRVVALKNLLSHGMKRENGDIISKSAIKHHLKEMVSKENPAKPLSDEKIKEGLALNGIKIERRTVAKYRESLKILPTHLRKKVV